MTNSSTSQRGRGRPPKNKDESEVDPTQRIVGAKAEAIGGEAERALASIRSKGGKEEKPEPLTPEQIKEARERELYLKDLCDEIVDAEFTILTQKKLDSLSYRWNKFFHAWGIEMAGKVAATIALALGHASAFGDIHHKIQADKEGLPADNPENPKPN